MTPEPTSDTVEMCVSIRNTCDELLAFFLEPWGEEYSIPSDCEFVVLGRGPREGSGLWIEYGEKTITVTGWTGSIVQVFSEGQALGGSANKPAVPDF